MSLSLSTKIALGVASAVVGSYLGYVASGVCEQRRQQKALLEQLNVTQVKTRSTILK